MSQAAAPAPYLTARIIHGALLAGQIMFLSIVLLILKKHLVFFPASGDYLLPIICGMLTIPSMFMAPFIEQRIYKGKNDSEITPQLRQTGSLVKYALWEGPCLFAIIVMLVTKSLITLPLVVIILALFFMNPPKAEHFSTS